MLMVVALLGMVTGTVVVLVSGAQESSETRLVQVEMAEIRKACQRFAADLGEPPRFLAELMQAPPATTSEADAGTRWWWRSAAERKELLDRHLAAFDPATRRGWNGPYLRAEVGITDAEATQEKRIVRVAIQAVYDAASPQSMPGQPLPLLRSDYTLFAQKADAADGGRLHSHYQLDFSDGTTLEIFVRFVRNPFAAADAAGNEVARLGLGLRHD
jgi:hypothetical protein